MQQIGRFEVIEPLGQGGAGVVVRARDPQLGREVAVKLLLDVESERARQRFRTEGAALVRLRHANLLTVHEAGESQGRPYLVLALIEGTPLDEVLRQGALAPARAVEVVHRLSDAVAAVHAAGLLHRDLKPGNVILREDGEPVLVDFGLARDLQADAAGPTQTGAVLGTPGYWSPEQAAGMRHSMGPWTDVYGLGAVLYACLTGRPPIEARDFTSALVGAAQTIPDPPSASQPEIPAALDAICLKCLAKSPDDRYPHAAALRDDLARFQRGEDVEAAPPGPTLGQRALQGSGLLILAVLALLATLAWRSAAPAAQPTPSVSVAQAQAGPSPSASVNPPASAELPELPRRSWEARPRDHVQARLRETLACLRSPAWALLERDVAPLPRPEGEPQDWAGRARSEGPRSARDRLALEVMAVKEGVSLSWRDIAQGLAGESGLARAAPLPDPSLRWRLIYLLIEAGDKTTLEGLALVPDTEPPVRKATRAFLDALPRPASERDLAWEPLRALLVARARTRPQPHVRRRFRSALGTQQRLHALRRCFEDLAQRGEHWRRLWERFEGKRGAPIAEDPGHSSGNSGLPAMGTAAWWHRADFLLQQALGPECLLNRARDLCAPEFVPLQPDPQFELERRALLHHLVDAGEPSSMNELALAAFLAGERSTALHYFRLAFEADEERVRDRLLATQGTSEPLTPREVLAVPLEEAYARYWSDHERDLVALGWVEPLPEVE